MTKEQIENNDTSSIDPSTAHDEATQSESDMEQDKGDWYVVQCFSQYEYRVQSSIQSLIDRDEYKDKIYKVLLPQEDAVEIKNNKRVEKVVKIFPGYVFVQMEPDEKAWYVIRSLPGVAKFVGSKIKPTPVTEDEILKVLRKVGDKTKKVDIDFEEGEIIKVIFGPFRGYSGPISEINAERGKLKSLISIFGRETPVELDLDQVEKVV